ncbi:NDR1/HIN1-like protein 13 [Capsicum annuum]|nr:NDR1/HIN1-like protein 13 [Capsicum annuum]
MHVTTYYSYIVSAIFCSSIPVRSTPPRSRMEGRTPLSGNTNKSLNKLSSVTSLRLASAPDRSLDTGTYVVQIPRDQVYRVPPPENAKIVENHRGPDDNFPRKRRCGCCCWILLGLLIIGIIIGVTIGVIYMLYIPQCPDFSILGVHFKNVTDPNSRDQGQKNQPQQKPKFEFDLKVNNVNERMDVSFGQGKANFVYQKHDIGQGKYPSNSQKAKGSTNVDLNLDVVSNYGKLPDDIKKSIENGNKTIATTLMIRAPMEIKSWVRNLKKDLTITCDFDVQDLTRKSNITYNKCITDF